MQFFTTELSKLDSFHLEIDRLGPNKGKHSIHATHPPNDQQKKTKEEEEKDL